MREHIVFNILLALATLPTCAFGNHISCPQVILTNEYDRPGLYVVQPDGSKTYYLRTNRMTSQRTKAGPVWFWPLSSTYGPMIDVKEGQRVLDAGCGDGAFVIESFKKGIDIIGLDVHLSDDQKAWNRKRPPGKPLFVERSMADTGFPDESFDVVFTSFAELYYEFEKPGVVEADLKEASRILKSHGHLRIAGNPAERVPEDDPREDFLGEAWRGWNPYFNDLIAKAHFKRARNDRMPGALELEKVP